MPRASAGDAGGLSRDDVLENVTHYWLTNTGVSAVRLLDEGGHFAAWGQPEAFSDEVRTSFRSLR